MVDIAENANSSNGSFNSLWLSDAVWSLSGSGSTLVQVMACCLMAPSHYLNQYWHITSHHQSPLTCLGTDVGPSANEPTGPEWISGVPGQNQGSGAWGFRGSSSSSPSSSSSTIHYQSSSSTIIIHHNITSSIIIHHSSQRLRNFSRSHQPKWPLLKLITLAIFTSHQSNLADVVLRNVGHFSSI